MTARPTEFRHGDFVCDVEVFSNGDDIVVRFADPGRVEAAIEFLESLSPKAVNAYIPHHVDLVRNTTHVEYNGEY